MILIENIVAQNTFEDFMAIGGRTGSRTLTDQNIRITVNVNGSDAKRVIEAINSDGTIYPDKIIDALGSRKRDIVNEPIDLTRGIDL